MGIAFAATLACLAQPASAQLSAVSSADPVPADLRLRPLRGPKADVAVLILGGTQSGSLRVAGLAVPHCRPADAGTAGTSRVDFWVEIEGATLLTGLVADEGAALPESLRLELYAYAVTPPGEIAGSLSRWVRLPPTLLARLQDGGVKLAAHLDLPPGDYQLRILVRDALSHRFALRLLTVTVPTPHEPAPFLAPPLVADVVTAWIVARQGSDTTAGEEPESPPRLPAADFSALPVARPGREHSLRLTGCRLWEASLAARLLDIERQVVAELELLVQTPTSESASETLLGRVTLPEVPAGTYLLEVSARSETGSSTATLPLFIPAAGSAEAKLVWTELGRPDREARRPLELSDRGRASRRAAAVADAYAQILERLASGQLAEAAAELHTLEREVVEKAEKPRRALKWLTEGQNRVTAELLDHDSECLFPLLLLHLELHELYLRDRDANALFVNATRSRIRALAQVYAEEAESEMAAVLAATSLVEMASALEQAQMLMSTLTVLREALTLDDENVDALLDLAYQFQHHGFRQEALLMLERLVELDPRSDEGRLRLAVSLLQMDREVEAEAVLRGLIGDGSTPWVLAVAHQELGRLLLRRERLEEAVAVLDDGVRRLPSVQRLYVELAFALDRAGRRGLGRELIGRIPVDAGEVSPRTLYRLPPRSRDTGSRAELVRHGTARLPLLAAALAAMETVQ